MYFFFRVEVELLFYACIWLVTHSVRFQSFASFRRRLDTRSYHHLVAEFPKSLCTMSL